MPPMDDLLGEHRPYLDWQGLRDLIDRGHTVGSHTKSHPFCSRLRESDLSAELIDPASELRSELGLDALPFAYPFGDRLPPALEKVIAESDVYTCLLGTGGLSLAPTAPDALDRIEVEAGIDSEIFGRPVVLGVKRRLIGRN